MTNWAQMSDAQKLADLHQRLSDLERRVDNIVKQSPPPPLAGDFGDDVRGVVHDIEKWLGKTYPDWRG